MCFCFGFDTICDILSLSRHLHPNRQEGERSSIVLSRFDFARLCWHLFFSQKNLIRLSQTNEGWRKSITSRMNQSMYLIEVVDQITDVSGWEHPANRAR